MLKNTKLFTRNDIIVPSLLILIALEIITENFSILIRSYRTIRFFDVFYSEFFPKPLIITLGSGRIIGSSR